MFPTARHDILCRPRSHGRPTDRGVLWAAFLACVSLAVCGCGCTLMSLVQRFAVGWAASDAIMLQATPTDREAASHLAREAYLEGWPLWLVGFVMLWLFFTCTAAVLWVKILATPAWRGPRYAV